MSGDPDRVQRALLGDVVTEAADSMALSIDSARLVMLRRAVVEVVEARGLRLVPASVKRVAS